MSAEEKAKHYFNTTSNTVYMTVFDTPPVLDEESLRNESITKTINNKYSRLYCLS